MRAPRAQAPGRCREDDLITPDAANFDRLCWHCWHLVVVNVGNLGHGDIPKGHTHVWIIIILICRMLRIYCHPCLRDMKASIRASIENRLRI